MHEKFDDNGKCTLLFVAIHRTVNALLEILYSDLIEAKFLPTFVIQLICTLKCDFPDGVLFGLGIRCVAVSEKVPHTTASLVAPQSFIIQDISFLLCQFPYIRN